MVVVDIEIRIEEDGLHVVVDIVGEEVDGKIEEVNDNHGGEEVIYFKNEE